MRSAPLFTCVDLEGGQVDRFRNALGSAPSAADVFATGDRRLFRKHGRVIGENCHALGFNVDFAPALDLAFEASRKVMSSAPSRPTRKKLIAYAREFLRGLGDAGVFGCGKHFPGLGEANLDTHHELPSVNKLFKKCGSRTLFRTERCGANFPFVMVSHAAFPTVTKDQDSRLAFKEMDHRHAAQEDWIPWADLLGRSGNGRSAGCGANRAGDDRAYSRGRRPGTDLPPGRLHPCGPTKRWLREAGSDRQLSKRAFRNQRGVCSRSRKSIYLEGEARRPARLRLKS